MADVFISYSKAARALTEEVAAELEHRGITHWWDTELDSGDLFRHELRQQIAAAKAVIVIWSQPATTSKWVWAEASLADRTGKLVPLRAHDVLADDLPLPFSEAHTTELDDTPAWLDVVRRRIGGELAPALARESDPRWTGMWLLDPKQQAYHPADARVSPASLLLARHGVVPFVELAGERAALLAWAEGASPAAARLVHGPGGLGKTRLAIETAAKLADEGWIAGFVPGELIGRGNELAEMRLRRLIEEAPGDRPLLLAVDYAEQRQGEVAWLTERLLRRRAQGKAPVRLLLLARAAGPWLQELFKKPELQSVLGREDGEPDAVALGGGARLPLERRTALFESSIDAFRRVLEAAGRQTPNTPPAPEQRERIATNEDYDRPLALQMEAVLHLYGAAPGEARWGIPKLLERVLGLETSSWGSRLKLDDGEASRQVARGVGQITLTNGAPDRDSACGLLMRDDGYGPRARGPAETLHGRLHILYGAGAEALGGLEPDLIGEHHVADVATEALVAACLDWAGGDRDKRRQILTVLNRASRKEHGDKAERARARLAHLLATRAPTLGGDLVHVAVGTPGALIGLVPELIRQVPAMDEAALAPIDDALPLYWGSLADLSLAVAERRVVLAREPIASHAATGGLDESAAAAEDSGSQGRLAHCLDTLGIRLGQAGRREDALEAAQEAVRLYRALAAARPDAFTADLARSLNNLGNALSDLGRRKDALDAAQEAADLYRNLAAARPAAFTPELARSVSVLSDILAALERHDEAAAAATEALTLLAPFAERHPESFGELARTILADVERYSAAAGLAPDATLLARVARVTTALPARELPPEITALMPILEALQARYDETGALDAALLAQLPDEIAAQVRAAAEQAAAGAPPAPDTES